VRVGSLIGIVASTPVAVYSGIVLGWTIGGGLGWQAGKMIGVWLGITIGFILVAGLIILCGALCGGMVGFLLEKVITQLSKLVKNHKLMWWYGSPAKDSGHSNGHIKTKKGSGRPGWKAGEQRKSPNGTSLSGVYEESHCCFELKNENNPSGTLLRF